MARFDIDKIPYRKQEQLIDQFCETIVRLRTRKLIKNFLKDLLNRQERAMIIRRLLIAEMLSEGFTYKEIIKQLHCGTSTIAKVERWLNFGRNGYKKAIEVKKR